ncbi:tRNA(Met) cytidine acetyltransferase TmcA [Enterobacteriaceae bacterium LUAb1]
MKALTDLTKALQQAGQRRLLVLSGTARWCQKQCQSWQQQLEGDWLHVNHAHSAQALLGQELTHAVYDASEGLSAELLAALSGTLRAGSWLLLCVPEWNSWPDSPDTDSMRWSETTMPISAPRFVRHMQRQLQNDADVILWRQEEACWLPPPPQARSWHDEAQQQQAAVLKQLRQSPPGITVLTAARGRGKSALSGMLAAHWPGCCIVTAPAKISVAVLAKYAGEAFHFIAPDTLLAQCLAGLAPSAEWLLVDEAAAIPSPQLHQLMRFFPRILLTTTVRGYEGTGRGFLLKFCASLPAVRYCSLDAPQRWAREDPLERIIDALLLFTEPEYPPCSHAVIKQSSLNQDQWDDDPLTWHAFYQLLTRAHYRTTPLDLRRMMDAPGQHFAVARQGEQVAGALWLVDEGALAPELAAAVWAGFRRPKGSLVAQSLAAHAGWPEAAQLRSRRISRIAIAPALRRQGKGRALLAQAEATAISDNLDFLSVSFGYTPALLAFWLTCGFRLVRLGTQREASSGCYSAMAIKPLTPAATELTERIHTRLRITLGVDGHDLSPDEWPFPPQCWLQFDEQSWRDAASFAWGQRPFESVLPALQVLLSESALALPLLRAALRQQLSHTQICQQYSLTGRRELIRLWRQETRQALLARDHHYAMHWFNYFASLR